MNRTLGLGLLALLLGACEEQPPAWAQPQAARGGSGDLVPFATDESAARLSRATARVDFFPLANQFEGQQHGGMCGPTTAVIVLNTLRADAPPDRKPVERGLFPVAYEARLPPGFDPRFRRYTQGAFFADPRVTAVKTEARFYGEPTTEGKRDPGMQLRQLHDILRGLGLDSTLRVLDDSITDAQARDELVANLARPGDYVIVNYTRKPLGQKGGGHISPVGAYDPASDSFLVLDVNPNDGKRWVWVPARRLFEAMRTRDTIENRGYLLVKEGSGP